PEQKTTTTLSLTRSTPQHPETCLKSARHHKTQNPKPKSIPDIQDMASRNLNNITILLGASLRLTAFSGAHGEPGANGHSGTTSIVTTTDEPAGANCAAGGVRITSWLDADGDGTLSGDEAPTTRYVCDGEAGTAGPAGPAGPTGPTGPQGPPGDGGGAGDCA